MGNPFVAHAEGDLLEIRVLKYFLMVAREENITRAANLLHVTQPTLSRQLMQLEEELGVKLFHRGKHRILLTEEGLLLRRRAEEIVSLSEKTREDLRQREGMLSGKISIGSGELQSSRFLAQLIASFREQYPLVQFELYSGDADSIKERIERGLLDVGLLTEPVDITKYEFLRLPLQEQWGALVREDSPLAAQNAVTPEDLAQVPLLLPQREIVQDQLAHWFGPYWDRLNVVGSGNLQYNKAMLVRELPSSCVVTMKLESHFDGLRFLPLSPQLQGRSVLVWKRTQAFSLAARAFLRHGKASLQNLTASKN